MPPILTIRSEEVDPQGVVEAASELLRRNGPIIDGVLSSVGEDGQSVSGFVLVDTGAAVSCIDVNAADTANLPIVGKAITSSASHANVEMPEFEAEMFVGNRFAIKLEKAMGANLSNINSHQIIALIGRDLLQHATFNYNGLDGSITIAI